jgi:hypothetical protein
MNRFLSGVTGGGLSATEYRDRFNKEPPPPVETENWTHNSIIQLARRGFSVRLKYLSWCVVYLTMLRHGFIVKTNK